MKKKLPFLALFLLVIGFVIWKYIHRPVELEQQPIVLGHGGMGVRSPYALDSKRSIKMALSYPIDGTEIDVRMTSDGVLIAFHDEELPIHSGCPGNVWEKTYSDIYACSHGVFHKAEPVSSLDTLLSTDWKDGTIFSLDMKPALGIDSNRQVAFAEAVMSTVKQYPQYRFLLEGQHVELLKELKRRSVDAKVFYYGQSAEEGKAIILENGFDGISINAALIQREEIQDLQKSNIQVMIWGTGSVFANREVLNLHADIIQTDAIKSMVTLLQR